MPIHPASVDSSAVRLGRNDPCPCGSGRKFKLCCGRAGSSKSVADVTEPPRGKTLGRLTEASRDREAVEKFRQMQVGLPDNLLRTDPAPSAGRVDAIAAERHRGRGMRLVEAGQLSGGIAELSRAVRLDPRDAAAHRALGRALLQSGRLAEAAATLELATTLEDNAGASHDLAVALRRQNLDEKAIAAYRRTLDLDPEMAEAHAGLAELLDDTGEDDEAIICYRRAAASAPDTTFGCMNLAKAAVLEADFSEAERHYRKAIVRDPADDRLWKLLGDALTRQGRFDEAIAAFDQALQVNPLQVAAHFAAVEARKCTERDRPRVTRMLAALDEPVLDDVNRAHLHFALGKLFDDLGEYENAMRHFDMANAIKARFMHFDAPAFAADVDRLIRRFTPEFFAAHAEFGCDDETPVLIVGMPRSGTTLVEQILSSHPKIAGGGELPYWIKRMGAWGIAEASYLTAGWGRDLSAGYLELLRRIGPTAARVTDKLPFNVLCLGLIHLLLPKARIIQCRRHPLDTCLSIYFANFRQAITFAADKADIAAAYRQYARLMDHWRAALPSERFLEVEYERLVADPETITRQMIAFCGLDWDDACLRPERNRRTVTTASLWQARQPVYNTSIARWRRYRPWLGKLADLLTPEEIG